MPLPKSISGGAGTEPAAESSSGILLERPVNRVTRRIFVAATRMNVGKTTTCMGLFAAIRSRFPRVGFIKPVGQRFVEVGGLQIDEDSVLLESVYNMQSPIESMSPVTIDPTFTRRYLRDPGEHAPRLTDKICRAFDRVAWEKDFVLIEGTGHAGVGAVFDLSNARVARLLDAQVILVAEGGIGRPIDEIALNKALFDQAGVPVAGAILNKVQPDKIESIRPFVEQGLGKLGVRLLGILPEQKMLSAPNLSQVASELGAQWVNAESKGRNARILRFVIGAMAARDLIDYLSPDSLLITPGDRDDIILGAIAATGLYGRRIVAGVCLTKDIMPHPRLMEMLSKTNLPVMLASEDSYTVASRINNMTIKTIPEDTDKIPVIQRMVQEHVDLDQLLGVFGR